ncbi:MAG: hypothetical protein QG629_500 [Patescibacteria group bacterium]|nr:hypothetical protein [Candidatus Saccharibacteria bacterium]MDQ5963418.1 hypothetical protein [Patescibacteria group bacterium]
MDWSKKIDTEVVEAMAFWVLNALDCAEIPPAVVSVEATCAPRCYGRFSVYGYPEGPEITVSLTSVD